MIGCPREAELEAALDRRLDGPATREVFQHAQTCLRCREARAEFEALARCARSLPLAMPDPLAARRVRARVMHDALMGPPQRSVSRVRVALAVAAVTLVATAALAATQARARTPHAPPRVSAADPVSPRRVERAPAPATSAAPALTPVAPSPTAMPRALAAPASVDAGPWFREGSFAYARGDHDDAVRALERFLLRSTRRDPRREDARYLHILSLQALSRVDALTRAAEAYRREFPAGLRRAEVVLVAAQSLAAAGRCNDAVDVAHAMPAEASERVRGALTRVLRCTPAPR